MNAIIVFVFSLTLVHIHEVTSESFDERSQTGRGGGTGGGGRTFIAPEFVAPDITDINSGNLELKEVPKLSEFNYNGDYAPRQLLIDSFKRDVLIWNFQKDSEVSSSMALACQKCMISGNMDCVASICRLHIDVRTSGLKYNKRQKNLGQSAFATGSALHGDILCSLCKHTNDVMCTMKFCVDSERGQNARDSGVQCMNGFCRWEKEAMVNVGFNNYYQAWWQPQNLYFFFDHVTKEIATAYGELISSTSKAINGLG